VWSEKVGISKFGIPEAGPVPVKKDDAGFNGPNLARASRPLKFRWVAVQQALVSPNSDFLNFDEVK
jgi:hypothetical protein